MSLIDAHSHLDDEQFVDNLDAVIARAADAGVAAILTVGVDVASSRAAIALAEKYDIVYAAVGIHPHCAESFNDATLAEIRALAAHRKVVAIGEIGLDFHYAVANHHRASLSSNASEVHPRDDLRGAPREVQERTFIAHLDLADELGKPVVIHDRDAHAALMGILRRRNGKPRGILHCFSGDLAMARQAVALGYVISFAGSVTFKNAPRLHEIARALPLEHIVLETDAPYLSPLRGKRNEPANVAHVAAKIAELKHIALDVVEEATTHNCMALFGLSKTPRSLRGRTAE